MPEPAMIPDVLGVVAMIVKDHEVFAARMQPGHEFRPDEQALSRASDPGHQQMSAGQQPLRIDLTEIPEINHAG